MVDTKVSTIFLYICGKYELEQHRLDYLVADIHSHHPAMGYRQIRDHIQNEHGMKYCDISIWKSMQRLNVHGYTRKRKQPVQGGLAHIRYSNLLNRNFKADKPMEKVVTDVTYIRHKGKWWYLAGYLDLYNNELLEWELSDTFDNFLVMRPAKRLLEKAKSTERQVA